MGVTWLGAVTPEAFAPTKTLMDVVPSVRPKFEALLAYANSLGLKPTIRSAGRTCEQQNYQKEAGYSGASMCRSMHVLGHAIDIDISPSTCANYIKLGEWWEKQGGVWGGRWTQFGACGDAGHFQYGFDGAGAVPVAVCPEGLSLSGCQTLRSEYLTKEMAKSPRTSGGGLLTGALIILVGVGFVWAALNVKPGKKLAENPRLRFQEIKNKSVKIYEFDGEFWRDSNDRRVGPAFDQERAAVAYAVARGWTERGRRSTAADVNHYVRVRLQQGHGIFSGQSSTKVYIADVLGALRVTKAELLEMHRKGEITLGRLDLVNALTAAERVHMRKGEILAWSGAPDTATYHVVEKR